MQKRKVLVTFLVLMAIIVFMGSQRNLAFAQGFFEQPVTVTCDLCNGAKTIKHTLTYQILTDNEEQNWPLYPAGLHFRVVVIIKNTYDYEGDFSVKETIDIGGHASYETRTLHLGPQESGTEVFPPTDWYYAGVYTHSHNLQVTAPQVAITCPRCNGTGLVTHYVTDWTKISIIALIVVSAVVIPSALFIVRKRRKPTATNTRV